MRRRTSNLDAGAEDTGGSCCFDAAEAVIEVRAGTDQPRPSTTVELRQTPPRSLAAVLGGKRSDQGDLADQLAQALGIEQVSRSHRLTGPHVVEGRAHRLDRCAS